MKTNLLSRQFSLLLLVVALTPTAAQAQFDQGGFGGFGGGMDFPKPAWEQFKLNTKTRLKLDFRNASVDAVLSVFSKASGIPIVKDPLLKDPITIQSPTELSLKDAFSLLNAVLGVRNFDLTKSGNLLLIKARPQSGRGGSTSGRTGGFGGFDPSMISGMMSGRSSSSSSLAPKVYQLKYASASQVARVINDVFQGSGQQSNPLAGLGSLLGGGGAPGAPGTTPAPPTGTGTPPPNGPNPGPDPDPQRGGFGGFPSFGGSSSRGGFPSFGGQGLSGLSSLFGGRGGSSSVVRASADDYSNSVIVNAPTREQDQVADLIAEIDKETEQPQKSQVFKLEFADASSLVTVVQNVLIANVPRGRGGAGGTQSPIDQRFGGGFSGFGGFGRSSAAAGQGNVVAEPRTNSLIITGTQENLDLIGKVVKELDKPITFENSTFVITLENARADQMADVLNQSFGSRTSGRTNTRTTGLTGATSRTNTNRTTGGNSPTGLGGRSQDIPGEGPLSVGLADPMAGAGELATNVTVQQGFGGFGGFGGSGFSGFSGLGGTSRSSQQNQGTRGLDANGRVTNLRDLTGQVTIIPDINTNSVIIVTSPQNRELLQQIVDQLDKIPEQVMIETVIVEASLDANSKLGVEWNFTQNKILGETGSRGAGSSSFGNQATTTQPQGLRYTLTGGQYGAFLQSLQSDARFEVLSTPRIFTSNNATAEINISQSLPYVTSTQTNANGVSTFNYAFLDVGIILTVTPRITSNGFVTMDVTQTANDFVRYTDFNAPVVNQREAQTTVSVQDGETIVLGGIIKNSISATTNKLPVLGDIPVLGKLFQSNTTTKSKTELLVFLTPRIVRDPAEARKLRENTARQMQSKLKDKLPQFGGTEEKAKPKTDDKTPPVEKKKTGG